MRDVYNVIPINHPINEVLEVPGSKSITNRALLLASGCKNPVRLKNVLFSEDSRAFIKCLQQLGYDLVINEESKTIRVNPGIPVSGSKIDVCSAGTAARFLTAFLATYPGVYEIIASNQMKKRPMKPLLDCLEDCGAKIQYTDKAGYLPIVLHGTNMTNMKLAISGNKSSQFISAMLLSGNRFNGGLEISVKDKQVAPSYINISMHMIKEFGGDILYKDNTYVVKEVSYCMEGYFIEPDVSSSCYFYSLAALTGGTVTVKNLHMSSIQGDIAFLDILSQMGCMVKDTDLGVCVQGPADGVLRGVDVDMNDFSDQALTLAAIAPFASGETTIRNIAHLRFQESDRINVIATELGRLGINVKQSNDAITIFPGEIKPGSIETYDDHRVAMAFSLIGSRVPGIKINNPNCCAKTFENYFSLLTSIQQKYN